MHVVHQLKYQGRLALAPAMGRMLGEAYRRYWSECPVDGVLPIPLHRRRLRRRGFNQADVLLRSWLKDAAAAGQPGPARGARILERIRATPPQTGLKRSERRRNIRGAFRVAAHGEIENRRLLLVDDVFTTGATVEEAARVLRAAGAASVDVLTLARTPR
jgi:ComF family protein